MKIFGHSSKDKPQTDEEKQQKYVKGREKKQAQALKIAKNRHVTGKTKYMSRAKIYDVQGR